MTEAMADLRLGLDATDLKSKVERAGFEAASVDEIEDAYVVEGPDGRKAELPLFVVHARKPVSRTTMPSPAATLPSTNGDRTR
jgi:hypothetical protein